MQCGNEFYNFWKFRDFVYGFDVVSYNMTKYYCFEQPCNTWKCCENMSIDFLNKYQLSNISLDEIIRAKIGYTYLVVFEIGVYNWTLCKTSRMHIMTIGSTWSLKTLKVFTGISKVSPVDARTFTPLSKSNFELKQQISKILFNPVYLSGYNC